jgi:hypothetical protein
VIPRFANDSFVVECVSKVSCKRNPNALIERGDQAHALAAPSKPGECRVAVLSVAHRQQHQVVLQRDARSKRREQLFSELRVRHPEIRREPATLAAELLLGRDKVAHAVGRPDPIARKSRDDSGLRPGLGLQKIVARRIEFLSWGTRIELQTELEPLGDAPGERRSNARTPLLGVDQTLRELKLALNTARTERRALARSARSRRQRRAQFLFDCLPARALGVLSVGNNHYWWSNPREKHQILLYHFTDLLIFAANQIQLCYH